MRITSARTFGLLALAVLAACGGASKAPPSGAAAAHKAPEFRLRDFRFKSGLRLVGEEDHNAPVAGLVTVVGVGSTSDPPGQEGLAHLVEHLTFRAKQSGQTMWNLFHQAGSGLLNATTSLDSTVYYEFGPRDALGDFLLLEATRISDPLAGVDQRTFEIEREVVRNELRQRGETVVDGAVWGAVAAAVYPSSHPYSRPPIGTHQSLDRITLADAQEFVKKHYRPANMTMIVSGDLPLERLDKWIGQSFPQSFDQPSPDAKPGPRLSSSNKTEPPEPPPARGLTTMEGMVTAPELYIAWSLPRSYGETSHLATIAAGGAYGAIDEAESVDNDVIGGTVELIPGAEAATVIARVVLREGSHPEKSMEHVLNGLVYNWLPGAPPDLERVWFSHVISTISTSILFRVEDIAYRMVERADFAHFTGDLAYFNRRMQAIGELGPSQLQSFLARYLNRDRARGVLVRPIAADRRAGAGKVGIGVGNGGDDVYDMKFDLASIRKLAIPAGLTTSFHMETLPNGLAVEAARVGNVPVVTVGLTFRGGLSEESENGVAALAWRLATPGNPLHGKFTTFGAMFDRRASADGLNFRVRARAQYLDKILAILADYVSSLEVRTPSFNNFERYSLPYMLAEQQRPEYIGERDFRQALFGKHVFGHTSQISKDHLPDRSAANRWIAANVTPQKAVLAIAGDIDPHEAIAATRSAFGDWTGEAGSPDPEALGSSGTHSEVVTHRAGATQAVVHLGCRLPTTDWAYLVRARAGAIALSERLRSVRDARGLSYGVNARVEMLRGGTAVLHVEGAIENAGLPAALRTLRGELVRLTAVRKAAWDSARWAMATRYNVGITTTGEWVNRALEAGKNGWSLQSVDNVPEVLASSDPGDILSALRSCANDGVLSIVGDEAIIRKAIKEAWLPSPQERRATVTRP